MQYNNPYDESTLSNNFIKFSKIFSLIAAKNAAVRHDAIYFFWF